MVAVPAGDIPGPINPDRVRVFQAILHSDVVGKQEPGFALLVVIKGRVLHLFVRRHDGLGRDRPGAVQVFGPGQAEGAFDGPVGRGAEKHQVFVALPDDLARAGGSRVVGARLGAEWRHRLLLVPRTFRGIAPRLHGQVRKSGNQIRRRSNMRGSQVKHVPLPAIEKRHAVGR